MPELVYAALLYKDGNSIENPASTNFVQGTETEDGKLNFSFQKPENTDETFTLEIFAFAKTSDDEEGTADENTPQFSKETALLSGSKMGLSIVGDEINVSGDIALKICSKKPGTVRLKIKVPDGCSLEIDDTANFDCKKDVSASDTYTIVEKDGESGIAAGAYQLKFTVKKGDEIVHIFSEYINVINGFCTDTWWNGAESSAVKEISQSMISSTVYVRGSGGWYDTTSPYNDGETATADDSNSGSFLSPFKTIQKAIKKIIAINDGASAYTIYIDGTLAQDTAASVEGMADFTALDENLTLTIKALSDVATLDANKLSRVINAKPESGALNLTLENLTLTGGNTSENGGGIYISKSAEVTMTDDKIKGNKAARGGGVYLSTSTSTFTMKGDATISGNILSEEATNRYGSEVYVSSGTFTMGGSASIPAGENGKNDVYLENGKTITITETLSASSPVATITPSAYTANRPLLSAGDGVTLDGSICSKFAVTPQDDGTEWRVALDGTDGVLIRKYEMGDTGPGGGYVFHYSADGFTVNGKTCHYLECSKEQLGKMTWCPCTSSGGFCELTLYDAIGQGYANTQAILSHPNHASATVTNCAAKACAEYSTETTEKGEWFLPSQKEVLYIYRGISVASEEPLWMSQASFDGDNSKAGYIKVRSNGSTATSKSKNIVTGVRAMRAF